MTKKTVLLGFIFGFLCFALGYFVGREHLRYQLQQQIRVALYPHGDPAVNEAIAVGSLRTINTAEDTYSATYKTGFSRDLLSLGGDSTSSTANAAGLIDSELASGTKKGYTFTYVPGPVISGVIKTYSVRADPTEPGGSGYSCFYTDETGVIRSNETHQAGPKDSPLPG